MSKRFLIFALLALVIALPAGAQQSSSDKNAMGAAQMWASKIEEIYSKQDAARNAELYTTDATFLPATTPVAKGGVISGRDGIKKFFAGVFERGLNRASAKVLEAHSIGGSAIWAVGALALSGEHDGKPIQFTTRYGQILVKSGKTWRARMMVASSDAPPSGADPAK